MLDNLLTDQYPILDIDVFTGSCQRRLYERYGDPRITGWGQQWLTAWEIRDTFSWFPIEKICLHRDLQVLLCNALRELEIDGLYKEIRSCGEAFDIRYINGSDSVLSVHSWGVAIDLNPEENPLGSDGRWSREFLNVMSRHGIYPGQLWTGRKDPMHFSMVNG